jgi:glycosyltransferase involved in cell wall biosynthesis
MKADAIIADSEFTRQEIINKLHMPTTRVETIHLGIDHHRFMSIANARVLLSQHYPFFDDQGTKFLLNVGTELPRKNLDTVFKAISILPSQIKLIRIGSPGGERFREFTLQQIQQYGIQNRVILVDQISDEELPLFYNAADVYVCPSFLEGFGFPVLEAMACGTPVVCANTSSLPEITGDGGILIQPEDANEFAQAINNFLENSVIRTEMIEKGQYQASKFTWEQTIQNTKKVYEKYL